MLSKSFWKKCGCFQSCFVAGACGFGRLEPRSHSHSRGTDGVYERDERYQRRRDSHKVSSWLLAILPPTQYRGTWPKTG